MHARGFHFSDDLYQITSPDFGARLLFAEVDSGCGIYQLVAQLDGRYSYFYTDPDSYEPLAQVRNWTTEDGENCQQTHYFHCDQIGIPREIANKDGNLVWGWTN